MYIKSTLYTSTQQSPSMIIPIEEYEKDINYWSMIRSNCVGCMYDSNNVINCTYHGKIRVSNCKCEQRDTGGAI